MALFYLLLTAAGSTCLPCFSGTCDLADGSLLFSALAGKEGGWSVGGGGKIDLEAIVVRPSLLWSWGSAEGIVGFGSLASGMAFRKSPFARAGTASTPPWSFDGSAPIAGFRAGGLSLVWKAGASSLVATTGVPEAPGPVLMRTPRLAVIELRPGGGGDMDLAAAIQLSRLPDAAPSQGWRPGSTDQPSQTLLGISIASRRRTGDASLCFWASGLCGNLSFPSAAASIQADSGMLVLDGGQAIGCSLSFFLYGAGKGFLDIEGGLPSWDRLLDAKLDFRGRNWRFGLNLSTYSRNSDAFPGYDLRLPDPDATILERLLWRWKTDILCCSFAGALGNVKATLKAKADSEGPAAASASADLGFSPQEGWRLSLGADVKLVRKGAAEADVAGEDEPDEEAELDSGSGSLLLMRLGARITLDRSDSPESPALLAACFSLFASRTAGGWEPFVDFVLQSRIRPFKGIHLSLKLASPSGGYSLIRLPESWPQLSLSFSLGGNQS